jgi:hypothetical protein
MPEPGANVTHHGRLDPDVDAGAALETDTEAVVGTIVVAGVVATLPNEIKGLLFWWRLSSSMSISDSPSRACRLRFMEGAVDEDCPVEELLALAPTGAMPPPGCLAPT